MGWPEKGGRRAEGRERDRGTGSWAGSGGRENAGEEAAQTEKERAVGQEKEAEKERRAMGSRMEVEEEQEGVGGRMEA